MRRQGGEESAGDKGKDLTTASEFENLSLDILGDQSEPLPPDIEPCFKDRRPHRAKTDDFPLRDRRQGEQREDDPIIREGSLSPSKLTSGRRRRESSGTFSQSLISSNRYYKLMENGEFDTDKFEEMDDEFVEASDQVYAEIRGPDPGMGEGSYNDGQHQIAVQGERSSTSSGMDISC